MKPAAPYTKDDSRGPPLILSFSMALERIRALEAEVERLKARIDWLKEASCARCKEPWYSVLPDEGLDERTEDD